VSPTLSAILIRGGPLTGEPHDLPIVQWMSGSSDTAGFALRAGAPGVTTMATYHLRYDPRARRLRGTRDGDSVWFAPLQVLEPRHCRDGITVPAPFDLSGSWLAGKGAAEPAAASVTVRPDCRYNPAAWVVQQTKDSVEAWSFPESMNQGTRSLDTPVNVPATGRVSGLDVTIQSGASLYHLRYDPESGHLSGTLAGPPCWAVLTVRVGTGVWRSVRRSLRGDGVSR
jgi:hypothetical protein